jgi:VIT1/CCC1 family predicted Fe2+/Mn2+ transporter
VVVLRGLGQALVMALGSAVVALAAAGLWTAVAGGAHPRGVVLFVCLPLAVAGLVLAG